MYDDPTHRLETMLWGSIVMQLFVLSKIALKYLYRILSNVKKSDCKVKFLDFLRIRAKTELKTDESEPEEQEPPEDRVDGDE